MRDDRFVVGGERPFWFCHETAFFVYGSFSLAITLATIRKNLTSLANLFYSIGVLSFVVG